MPPQLVQTVWETSLSIALPAAGGPGFVAGTAGEATVAAIAVPRSGRADVALVATGAWAGTTTGFTAAGAVAAVLGATATTGIAWAGGTCGLRITGTWTGALATALLALTVRAGAAGRSGTAGDWTTLATGVLLELIAWAGTTAGDTTLGVVAGDTTAGAAGVRPDGARFAVTPGAGDTGG